MGVSGSRAGVQQQRVAAALQAKGQVHWNMFQCRRCGTHKLVDLLAQAPVCM